MNKKRLINEIAEMPSSIYGNVGEYTARQIVKLVEKEHKKSLLKKVLAKKTIVYDTQFGLECEVLEAAEIEALLKEKI